MSTLHEAAAACCACIRVRWLSTPGPDGAVSGRWVCSTCEREFVPAVQLEQLRAELAASEQLVEATQAERSAAIVKATELTAEVASLREQRDALHARAQSAELEIERLQREASEAVAKAIKTFAESKP